VARDVDHASLVRAHPDRPISLAHLDLEAQPALVDHLAQLGTDRAGGALQRCSDVLYADLEADRRPASRQLFLGEDRGVALIIAIIDGVERTCTASWPPTSVNRRSSTTKLSSREAPGLGGIGESYGSGTVKVLARLPEWDFGRVTERHWSKPSTTA
jgi:hypothetical protein